MESNRVNHLRLLLAVIAVLGCITETPAHADSYEHWAQGIAWGEAGSRNPFFGATAGKFTHGELQREAMAILEDGEPVPARLKAIARSKKPYFPATPQAEAVSRLLGPLPREKRTQAALEFALTTFTSAEHDAEFRILIMEALKASKLSDLKTVELLLPLTRGVYWAGGAAQPQAGELVKANDAIRQISERDGHAYVSAQRAVDHEGGAAVDQFADAITHAKSTEVKSLGGGVNDSLKVTFVQPDGARVSAIYKSLAGSRPVADLFYEANPAEFRKFVLPIREARAANFYHALLDRYRSFGGKVDIQIPPTVEGVLVHDGKSYGVGSFQRFQEGFQDLSAFQAQHARDWQLLRNTPEWREAESVVRTVDYVYGNSDRFRKRPGENIDKNVMIKVTAQDTPKGRVVKLESVRLIDNGLGLPGHADYGVDLMPIREHLPEPMRKALASFKAEELARLVERERSFLPEAALEDFLHRLQLAAVKATAGTCDLLAVVRAALRGVGP